MASKNTDLNQENPIQAMIRANTLVWVHELGIKNEKGDKIDFKNYPFLIDIYADTSKKIVVRKSAQVGISTWAILRALHDARYLQYNIIYTLPRASDVTKFVPSKVNEIIKKNPSLNDVIDHKSKNTTEQKQFGDGFIFFKGTISETEGIMVTSDRNIYDEYDRSDMNTIQTYHSRLEGEKSKKEEWFISTPTLPGYGIDARWEESDQRHWRFRCSRCQYEQHLEWDKNYLGGKYYICQGCHKTLRKEDIIKGKWIPRYPKREIRGYWINQMMLPWITPRELKDYFDKANKGVEGYSLEYFYNFKLGLPYANATQRMHASLVYQNITDEPVEQIDGYMGVDVQENELYVSIGTENIIYGLTILRDDDKSSKWEKLEEIFKAFKIKKAVIDAGYKPQDVLEFARLFPYKVYMNWYRDAGRDAKVIRLNKSASFAKSADFEEEIKVETSREQAIDLLIKRLENGKIKFKFNPHNTKIQELIKHMETMYARTVETKDGKFKREWASTGKNDFVHSLVYWYVATQI